MPPVPERGDVLDCFISTLNMMKSKLCLNSDQFVVVLKSQAASYDIRERRASNVPTIPRLERERERENNTRERRIDEEIRRRTAGGVHDFPHFS